MLAHVIERALLTCGISEVVLATGDNDRDESLAALAYQLGVRAFQIGPEWDVLHRYATVADATRADAVMRVTGDCPFLAPEVCAAVVDGFVGCNAGPTVDVFGATDYVSNDTTTSGYPDGTDCEVFSAAILAEAHRRARLHEDREHVTPWIRKHATCRTLRCGDDWRDFKLSVDTHEELVRARRLSAFIPRGDYSLAATLGAAHRARIEWGGGGAWA